MLIAGRVKYEGDFRNNSDYYLHDQWAPFIAMLDKDSNIKWKMGFSGKHDIYSKFTSIEKLYDGTFIVSGFSSANPCYGACNKEEKAWVLHIDETGQIIFDKKFGINGKSFGRKIIQLDNGNLLLGGHTTTNNLSLDYNIGYNTNEMDIFFLEMNSDGDSLSTHFFGGTKSDALDDFIVVDDKIHVVSRTRSNDGDILRTSNSNALWYCELDVQTYAVNNQFITFEFSEFSLRSQHPDLHFFINKIDNAHILISGTKKKPNPYFGTQDSIFSTVYNIINKQKVSERFHWFNVEGAFFDEARLYDIIKVSSNTYVFTGSLKHTNNDSEDIILGEFVTSSSNFIEFVTSKVFGKTNSVGKAIVGIYPNFTIISDINGDADSGHGYYTDYRYNVGVIDVVRKSGDPNAPIIYYSEAAEAVESGTPLKVHFKAKTTY